MRKITPSSEELELAKKWLKLVGEEDRRPMPWRAWIILFIGLAIESAAIAIFSAPYVADLTQKYNLYAGIGVGIMAAYVLALIAHKSGESLYKVHKQKSLVEQMISEVKQSHSHSDTELHQPLSDYDVCLNSKLSKELSQIETDGKGVGPEIHAAIKATQKGFLRRYGIVLDAWAVVIAIAMAAFVQRAYLYRTIEKQYHVKLAAIYEVAATIPMLIVLISACIMFLGHKFSFFSERSKQSYRITRHCEKQTN